MGDYNIFGESFGDWKNTLNRLVLRRVGLRLDDLPDMGFRDSFDAGTTPDEFFDEEVMPHLEDLGWTG